MTVIVRLALRHCLPFTHKDYFKLTDTHIYCFDESTQNLWYAK